MFEQILTPRSQPVVTPQQLASFGRFDLPQQYVYGSSPATYTDDWNLLLMMIDAATTVVETMCAQACLYEQILLTFDCFPNQEDIRNFIYNMEYAFLANPWWVAGFPMLDSIELVRRPVVVPSGSPIVNNLVITYFDPNGVLQTLSSTVYTIANNKVCLNVGNQWPVTDRRQDCVRITYTAGYAATDVTQVPSPLVMAILYLANHFYSVRQIVSVEPTTQVGLTLNRLLNQYRSMRIPR